MACECCLAVFTGHRKYDVSVYRKITSKGGWMRRVVQAGFTIKWERRKFLRRNNKRVVQETMSLPSLV